MDKINDPYFQETIASGEHTLLIRFCKDLYMDYIWAVIHRGVQIASGDEQVMKELFISLVTKENT